MISPPRALTFAAVLAAAALACNDITRPIAVAPNASRSFLTNPGGDVVVSPDNMEGWAFSDDRTDAACLETTVCGLVDGPAGAPQGSGSAELATTTSSDAKALVLVDYQGTRLDHVTELRYSSYRQSADAGNNVAIALQFNIDYDLTDASAGYQGRLVYEPYQGHGGNVPDTTWQSWDAKAGKWWGTRASVWRGGASTTNPCVQAAPCTWPELLATFPNVGVHATYGAVYLKAGSGWTNFRGNVDGLTIGVDGGTTTFNFERTVATVPALPPTDVPAWIYSDTNFVSGGSAIAGEIAKNVMMVAFESGTPAATRAAAIAQVGGSVVGGIPIDDVGEGVYYVRPGAGGTPAAVLDAVSAVAAAPGVAMAIPIMHDSVTGNYLRPRDGEEARQWELDKLAAGGMNWALESISAPMAWGCSTGNAATRVAVVDGPFHRVDDVFPTQVDYYDPHYSGARIVRQEHGNAVASILAARGNNGTLSTGVMWQSDLRLLQMAQPIRGLTGLPDSVTKAIGKKDGILKLIVRLRSAVLDGARVINLSQGITLVGHNDIPANEQGTVYLEQRVRPALRWVLKLRNELPTAPLFVISAGNGDSLNVGRDAYWNGFPMMRRDFPDRVLVVAATHADGARTQIRDDSNFGSLVDVAAPGDRVMAIDQDSTIFGFFGTSAAAPLAAGVAGLLVSFDSTLTTAEVKNLIVRGAERGGLVATSRRSPNEPAFYLNAYESLKLAAERPGAPLCGNRIWNDGNNNIFVERGSAPPEKIISRDPFDYAAYVNPYHGGKRIDLGFSYQYDWDAQTRSFKPTSYVNDNSAVPSGAWRSWAYVSDHDNTFWASRTDTVDAAGQISRVLLKDSQTGLVINDLNTHQVPGTSPGPPELPCIMDYPLDNSFTPQAVVPRTSFRGEYLCMGYSASGSWDSSPETSPQFGTVNETPILAVPAPQGDAVFVPMNIRHYSLDWSLMTDVCNPNDTTAETRAIGGGDIVVRNCSHRTVDVDTAVRALVYRIDVATREWTPVPLTDIGGTTLEAREINSLEISEDGKEMMLSTTRRARHSTFELVEACHDETLEWISIDRSTAPKYPPGHVIKRVFLPQGASCGGWVEAGGTLSPSRTALNPLGRIAPATRARTGAVFQSLRQQRARRAKAALNR